MPGKKDDDGTQTKVINPHTDTLKLDIEAAKASDAILIIIRGSPQGKKFVLNGDSFVLGRDKTATIQITDPNISREHAKVFREDGNFYVEDMGSRNGTHINDEMIRERKQLSKEDMIRIGTTVLKYLPPGELETLYHTNLTNMASMDKLTQVYNRNYISEIMEAEFKRAKALHTPLALIVFDIDDFKKINDTYGHDGGDYVLSDLTKTVRESGLRERDFIGRYGGEEFVVLLTNSTPDQAKDVAERIRKNIATHSFKYNEVQIPVTISLGVSPLTKGHHSIQETYKAADAALYKSKRSGKNRVTLAETQD